jgi:hypothetical protein
MTKQKLYAARTQPDVYAITEEMKEAARKRYNEQRAKRPKEKKEKRKEAPVMVAKKKK